MLTKLRRLYALARNLAKARVGPRHWPEAVRITLDATREREAIQKSSEFAPLVAIVLERRPRCVLEIGSARGGTLWAWTRAAAPDATLVSVDLPGGPYGGGDYDWESFRSFARADQRIELIRANSHDEDTRDRVAAALDRPVDFLFIDGDHTYEGARRDFELYSPFVKPGGIVAFHDVIKHRTDQECDVDVLWHELKGDYRHAELVDPEDDRGWGPWGGIGILHIGDPG
jgi:predicted O-methyltransferase YrrM